MNILVAGVHAVGKSFLCSPYADLRGWKHRSASQLIKEELVNANWGTNKQVKDANTNQLALISAVTRMNASGDHLLLDGHFVLRGGNDEFVLLGAEVFSGLNLSGVVLVEADSKLIRSRLLSRDGVSRNLTDIEAFVNAEHVQAQSVCSTLACPLIVLKEPKLNEFVLALDNLASGR